MDKKDKTDRKVKVELDLELVNQLIQLKKVGDTYSDVIRRLISDEEVQK